MRHMRHMRRRLGARVTPRCIAAPAACAIHGAQEIHETHDVREKQDTQETQLRARPRKRARDSNEAQREPAPAPASATLRIGVDEVGRGCLAGPVVAAAAWVDHAWARHALLGMRDSKRLTRRARERLAERMAADDGSHCMVQVAEEDAATVDRLNIRQATLLAMERATRALLARLRVRSGVRAELRVDGVDVPPGLAGSAGLAAGLSSAEAVVRGDASVLEISCASVAAKVHRDALMRAHHATWPEYGFDRHAGYPVPQHAAALAAHGPCPLHRRTFAGVLGARRAMGPAGQGAAKRARVA